VKKKEVSREAKQTYVQKRIERTLRPDPTRGIYIRAHGYAALC